MTVLKSRGIRYSLRTLLLLLTVGCVWLGYHASWAQQRGKHLTQVPEVRGLSFCTVPPTKAAPPYPLVLLGARRVDRVNVVFDKNRPPSDQVEKVAALFPEATIEVYCGYLLPRQCGQRPLTPEMGRLYDGPTASR